MTEHGTATRPQSPGPTGAGFDDPRIESAYDSGEPAFDPGAAHRYADGRGSLTVPPAGTAPLPEGSHSPPGGWRRVLLKLSGEALAGGGALGVDPDVVARIATEIAAAVRAGAQVAVVVGGGGAGG